MPIVGVHLRLFSGSTLTLELEPSTTGVLANPGGSSLVEELDENDDPTGYFEANVNAVGLHWALIKEGAVLKAQGWVKIVDGATSIIGAPVSAAEIADAVAGQFNGRVQLISQFDPDSQRFTITAGDRVVQEFANSAWPDLSDADFTFTVRNAADSVVITKADLELVDARRVRLTLTSSDTRIAARSDYVYDLQADLGGGDIRTLVGPEAPFMVRQDQSR